MPQNEAIAQASNTNTPLFISLGLVAVLAVTLYGLMKNRPEKAKRSAMLALSGLNILFFIAYKVCLSMDAEYLALSGITRYDWLAEMPMHLCNINLFFIPIGLLCRKRLFLGFGFFTGTLGAVMALLLPDTTVATPFFFVPRTFFFNITHVLIIVSAASLVSLGFFRPRFGDILPTLGLIFAVYTLMHLINTVLRNAFGSCANYFYTYGGPSAALNFFWGFIPKPYLYLLPLLVLFPIYLCIVCLPFQLSEKKHKDR